jgi:hypothetical protein
MVGYGAGRALGGEGRVGGAEGADGSGALSVGGL